MKIRVFSEGNNARVELLQSTENGEECLKSCETIPPGSQLDIGISESDPENVELGEVCEQSRAETRTEGEPGGGAGQEPDPA